MLFLYKSPEPLKSRRFVQRIVSPEFATESEFRRKFTPSLGVASVEFTTAAFVFYEISHRANLPFNVERVVEVLVLLQKGMEAHDGRSWPSRGDETLLSGTQETNKGVKGSKERIRKEWERERKREI